MKKMLFLGLLGCLFSTSTNAQNYCGATHFSPNKYYIKSFQTIGAVSDVSNLNTGHTSQGYSDYSSMAIEAYAGSTFEVKISTKEGLNDPRGSIWIDYNQNYIFDANERVVYEEEAVNDVITKSITVPAGIPNGDYRMRIRTKWYYGIDPCGEEPRGETEDYTLRIINMPSCPPATQLNATLDNSYSANLSWNGDTTSTYEIEWGAENFTQGNGTIIENVSGTSYNLTGFPTLDTNYSYYIRKKCSNTEYSAWVGPHTFYVGYCQAQPTTNSGNGISKFTIGSQEYTQGDVTYFNHTGTPADVQQGVEIPLKIKSETGSSTYHNKVWVDMNQNFEFEANEMFYLGRPTTANALHTTSITLPMSLENGSYRMRYLGDFYNRSNACYSGYNAVILDFVLNVNNGTVGTTTQELESLRIYPNPTSDWVSISNTKPIDTIEIYDVNGKRIHNQTTKENTLKINLQGFAKGTYFIRITSENKVSTEQLIIK